MLTKEHMIQVVEDYCRAETEKDKDLFMSLFAENAVHEDPVGKVRNEGLAKISAFWDGFQHLDVKLWLDEPPLVCGNELVALMSCTTGPAENRRRSGRIVDQFIFNEEGKITAVRAFHESRASS